MGDVYCMGLQALVRSVREGLGAEVAQTLGPRLLTGLAAKNATIAERSLDALDSLLKRFGALLSSVEHKTAMDALLRLLGNEKAALRKRSSQCLASLAIAADDALLDALVNSLLHGATSARGQEKRMHLQTIGALARSVGFRMSRFLDSLVPLFLSCCGAPDEDIEDSDEREERDELRENSLQGLESLLLRCPEEMRRFASQVIGPALGFCRYDPNYFGGDEDEDMETDMLDQEDEQDAGGDEDNSWKVRRAALKTTAALFSAHTDRLEEFYGNTTDVLFACVAKERQEPVTLEALATLQSLFTLSAKTTAIACSISSYLQSRLQAILRDCFRRLDSGAMKIRTATLNMLRSLVRLLNDSSGTDLEGVLEKTAECANDKNPAVRQAAFDLALSILERFQVTNYPRSLVTAAAKACSESSSRVAIEALKVLGALASADPYSVLAALLPVLQNLDSPEEVQETAIAAAGRLASHACPSDLSLEPLLSLISDKLDIEHCRIPALRALTHIGNGPADLSGVSERLVIRLAGLITHKTRAVREVALTALCAVLSNSSSISSDMTVLTVLKDSASLLREADSVTTLLCLRLLCILFQRFPRSRNEIVSEAYPSLLRLTVSPSTQEASLELVRQLIRAFVGEGTLSFEQFLGQMKELCGSSANANKTGMGNAAVTIAALCDSVVLQQHIVDVCLRDLESCRLLALLILGEIGPKFNLSPYSTPFMKLVGPLCLFYLFYPQLIRSTKASRTLPRSSGRLLLLLWCEILFINDLWNVISVGKSRFKRQGALPNHHHRIQLSPAPSASASDRFEGESRLLR